MIYYVACLAVGVIIGFIGAIALVYLGTLDVLASVL